MTPSDSRSQSLQAVYLSHGGGPLPLLGDRFRRLVGRDPLGVLLARGEPASGEPQM